MNDLNKNFYTLTIFPWFQNFLALITCIKLCIVLVSFTIFESYCIWTHFIHQLPKVLSISHLIFNKLQKKKKKNWRSYLHNSKCFEQFFFTKPINNGKNFQRSKLWVLLYTSKTSYCKIFVHLIIYIISFTAQTKIILQIA